MTTRESDRHSLVRAKITFVNTFHIHPAAGNAGAPNISSDLSTLSTLSTLPTTTPARRRGSSCLSQAHRRLHTAPRRSAPSSGQRDDELEIRPGARQQHEILAPLAVHLTPARSPERNPRTTRRT